MAELESMKQQLIMSQNDLTDLASIVADLSERISNVQTRVSDALPSYWNATLYALWVTVLRSRS